MFVHLVDGTFELFRAYFGAPPSLSPKGKEVGAVKGLLRSLYSLLRQSEVTHMACAFDHVIESFRNDLFAGYKTGEGIEAELRGQFELAERAVEALGVKVWSMVEFEADDALASGAKKFKSSKSVQKVILCSPDKDLAQCVDGGKVICWDRIRNKRFDKPAVVEKFGIGPQSIADWLALVGDSADGIPGIPRWGAKSSSVLLAKYQHLEAIPKRFEDWRVKVRGASTLSANLNDQFDEALLYKKLATLRDDVPLKTSLGDIKWGGADEEKLTSVCEEIGDTRFISQIKHWQ